MKLFFKLIKLVHEFYGISFLLYNHYFFGKSSFLYFADPRKTKTPFQIRLNIFLNFELFNSSFFCNVIMTGCLSCVDY